MAKKLFRRKVSAERRKLQQAETLLEQGRYDEAAELLTQYVRFHPKSLEALETLSLVYLEMGAMPELWEVAHQILELLPDESESRFNALSACVANGQLFCAVQHAEIYLARWSDTPYAKDVRQMMTVMKPETERIMADLGTKIEDMVLLEQATLYFSIGNGIKGKALTQLAIEKMPHLAAPLNNLSLAQLMEGKLDDALQTTRQIVERFPHDLHARCNLIQYLVRTGKADEAVPLIQQLREEKLPDSPDAGLKVAEAFSYAGEDLTFLAERYKKKDMPPYLAHLVAVSFARKNDLKQAKKYWQQAGELDLVEDNLDDLKLPAGEHNGAWAFGIQQWVLPIWIEESHKIARAGRAIKSVVEKTLKNHPHLQTVIPILLDRGDPMGTQFALMLAAMAGMPILKDFALGQRGSDQLRWEAALAAVEHGFLPRGKPVPLYREGKQTELMLLDYEIHDRGVKSSLLKPAQKLAEQTYDAVAEGKYEDAIQFAEKGLAIVPNEKTLMGFLATALRGAGREEEYKAATRRLAEMHPDYLFARCAMADMCAREGKIEEAEQWLEPILQQPRLHISEFRAMCSAQIEVLLAKNLPEGAKSWLAFWEQLEPDHPAISKIGLRIAMQMLAEGKVGRGWQKKKTNS